MDSTDKTSRSRGISGEEARPELGRNFQADQNQVASTMNPARAAKPPFAAEDEQAVQANVNGGTIPLQVNVCLPQLELNLTPEGLPPIQINLNLPPLQVNVTLPAPVFPLPAGQPAPARVEIAAKPSIQAGAAPELDADFLTKPWPESKKIEDAAEEASYPDLFEADQEIQQFAAKAMATGASAVNIPSLATDNPADDLADSLDDDAAPLEPKNIKPTCAPASAEPSPTPSVQPGLSMSGPSTADLTGPGGLFSRVSASPAQSKPAPNRPPITNGPPAGDIIGPRGLFTKIFGGLKPPETAGPANSEKASLPLDLEIDWGEKASVAPEMPHAPADEDMEEDLILAPLLEVTPEDAPFPLTEPEDLPLEMFAEEFPAAAPEAGEVQLANSDMAAFNGGLPWESELAEAEINPPLNPQLEELQAELSLVAPLAAKPAPLPPPAEDAYSDQLEAVLPAHDIAKEISEFADPDEPVELLMDLELVAVEAEAPSAVSGVKWSSELQKLNTDSLYRTPKAPPASAAVPLTAIMPELSVPEVTVAPVSAKRSIPANPAGPPVFTGEASTLAAPAPKPAPQQADSAKPVSGQSALEATAVDWTAPKANTNQPPARPTAQPPANQPAADQPLELSLEPIPIERITQVQATIPAAPAITVAAVEDVARAAHFPEEAETAAEAVLTEPEPQKAEERLAADHDLVLSEKEITLETHLETLPKPEKTALPSEARPGYFSDLPPELPTFQGPQPPPGTAEARPLTPSASLTPADQARLAYQAAPPAMPPQTAEAFRGPQPPPAQAVPAGKPSETTVLGQVQAAGGAPRPAPLASPTHQDFDFDLDASDLDLDMSSLDF